MGKRAVAAVCAAGAFVVIAISLSGQLLLCNSSSGSALRSMLVFAATAAGPGNDSGASMQAPCTQPPAPPPTLLPGSGVTAELLHRAREGHSSPSSVGVTSAAMLLSPTPDNPCPDEALFAPDLAYHLAWWPDGFLTPEVRNHTWYGAKGQSVDMRAQIINGTLYARSHPRGWHYTTRNAAILALTRRAADRYADVPGMAIPDVDYLWGAADVCHFIKVRRGERGGAVTSRLTPLPSHPLPHPPPPMARQVGTEHQDTPHTWFGPIGSMCDSPQAHTLPIPDHGFYNWFVLCMQSCCLTTHYTPCHTAPLPAVTPTAGTRMATRRRRA